MVDTLGFKILYLGPLIEKFRNAIFHHHCALFSLNPKNQDMERVLYEDIFTEHKFYKQKSNRLLKFDASNAISKDIILWVKKYEKNVDFITDEEGLGYPNIYFRVVRAGSKKDVGPAHADQWFWNSANLPFPTSHQRLKVWLPIIQDDTTPGLLVFPGTHKQNYEYSGHLHHDGKWRPVFDHSLIEGVCQHAPVKVGECVLFHDKLIHKGFVGSSNRLSLEFTLGQKV